MASTVKGHPERADAFRLLRERQVDVAKVVYVLVDRCLYLTKAGERKTALIEVFDGGEKVVVSPLDGWRM